MPVVKIRDRSYKYHNINSWSGGVTFLQQADNESEILENFEIMRDGKIVSRLGTTKVNQNSLGSNQIVGMSVVGQTNLIVAKAGTTFYYGAVSTSITFSSFTVPNSPVKNAVRFSSMEDTSSALAVYMVNPNFVGVVKWIPGDPAASDVASSPIGKYIHRYNKRLFVAGNTTNPNRLYHSEAGKPDSWPASNYIDVPPRHGHITGLAAQPGQLLVFCERSILSLRGDPPLRYTLDSLHEGIGADLPSAISTLGSVVYFVSRGALMEMSSSINLVSDSLRGFPLGATGTDSSRCYGVLTPYYYFLTYHVNTGVADYTPSASDPYKMLIYDRVRGQAFFHWVYPPTTSVGGTVGAESVIAYNDSNSIFMAGGNGNVYLQPFRQWSGYSLTTSEVEFTKDDNGGSGVEVSSRWRSRRMDFGSSLLTKQCRSILVGGTGQSVALTSRLFDVSGTLRSNAVMSNTTLPSASSLPVVDGATGYSDFSELQLDLTGERMHLRDVGLEWRGVRIDARTLP